MEIGRDYIGTIKFTYVVFSRLRWKVVFLLDMLCKFTVVYLCLSTTEGSCILVVDGLLRPDKLLLCLYHLVHALLNL